MHDMEAFMDIQKKKKKEETTWSCCSATMVQLGSKGESAHEMNALNEHTSMKINYRP